MDRPTYTRIQDALARALESPRESWQEIVDTCCGDDEAMRARLLTMLRHADDDTGVFSDEQIDSRRDNIEQALVSSAGDDTWKPERIGAYEIERVIGRGGSGVVFLARQRQPDRKVAVKLLRPSASTSETIERLRREAEILGKLQHPGIAQIFEAGSYDGGFGPQPYIAMELVDGPPITEYAKTITKKERVELVIAVANAVEHAHQRGVIHRDLKPDNVLVDARGQPKILDFGIARLQVAPGGDNLTPDGQMIGTVAYMAPEQAKTGEQIVGPTSDVFSLGAIAYELLTGQSPRQVDGLSITDLLRELVESEAPPARSIDPAIERDLETILCKSLEIRPQDRYPTAAALRVDLQRFIEHRPIAARRATRLDRALKFVRRHRALTIGSVTTVLALTSGLIGTAIQSSRARNAEQESLRKRYAAEMLVATSLTRDPATRGRSRGIVERWRPGAPLAAAVDAAVDATEPFRWEWHLLESLGKAETTRLDTPAVPRGVRWHPDGKRIAVATPTGLAVHDASTGRALARFSIAKHMPGTELWALSWDPSGMRIAAVGYGGLIVWTPPDTSDLNERLTDAETLQTEPQFWGALATSARGAGWTPNGDRVVLVDRNLSIYDSGTGERVTFIEGDYKELRAFPVDQALGGVLVARRGKPMQLYDLVTGEFRDTAIPPVTYPTAVVVNPAKTEVAITDRTGRLRTFEWGTWVPKISVQAHLEPALCVAWDPLGGRLATSSDDGTVRFFSTADGRLLDSFNGHHNTVPWVEFSPDGQSITSFQSTTEALVWDASTPSAARALQADALAPFYNNGKLSWDEAQRVLQASSFYATIRWRLPQGEVISSHASTGQESLDPTGRWNAAALPDSRLSVRSTKPDAAEATIIDLGEAYWLKLDWAHDGNSLAGSNKDGLHEVSVGPDGSLEQRMLIETGWSAHALDLSPSGDRVAASLIDRRCFIMEIDQPDALVEIPQTDLQTAIGFSWAPDGDRVAIGFSDWTLCVCDAASGARNMTMVGHVGRVESVAWHPSGSRIATGSADRTVKVWDPASGDMVASFPTIGPVASVCWILDGAALAAFDRLGNVTVWDATWSIERHTRPR